MLLRIWHMVLKELIQLWHNKLLLVFFFLGPLSEMTAIAYSTMLPIQHLPTAIVDLDRSQESRGLVEAMVNTETFDVAHYLVDERQAPPLIEQGKVAAAVIIPRGFAADLRSPQSAPPQVQILIDGAEPMAARKAVDSAEGAVASYGQRFVPQLASQGGLTAPLIRSQVRIWFNEELKESNFMLPSELGFMLEAMTLMLASLGIARERELGTLEQLLVTPLSSLELVIGKALPAVLMGYSVFMLMLSVALVGFGLPMKGSWPLLLALAFFYLLVVLGLGLMVSAIASTQLQALLLVFMFIMIEMVFSGYAFPVETMPPLMRTLSNLFPISHWLVIFRAILLKGAGISAFWPRLLALFLLGVTINLATVAFLNRKKLD
jgi:ABC-2 type transport system permease protein